MADGQDFSGSKPDGGFEINFKHTNQSEGERRREGKGKSHRSRTKTSFEGFPDNQQALSVTDQINYVSCYELSNSYSVFALGLSAHFDLYPC